MRPKSDIEKAVEKIYNEWFGYRGVMMVSYENIDGKMCVVLWVNKTEEILRGGYPFLVDGYQIIVLPLNFR